MIPKNFPEVNAVYGADQKEYNPLPVFKTNDGQIVTCWLLSEDEIKQITETRELYISVMTFGHPLQPLFVTTNRDHVIGKGNTNENNAENNNV